MAIEGRRTRIYPTKSQAEMLWRSVGFSRWLWNNAHAMNQEYYRANQKNISRFDLQKKMVAHKNQFDWAKECHSQIVPQVVKNYKQAWTNKFTSNFGKPKFKKKGACKDSFGASEGLKIIDKKTVRLPKIGKVKVGKVNPKYQPRSWVIERDKTGEYYLSYQIEVPDYQPPPNTINEDQMLAIDLGLAFLATGSDGKKIKNMKFMKKLLKSIKKLQRKLSRETKGSKNYEKTRIKLARKHKKIRNQRRNYLHLISKRMINENQVIITETLQIQQMMKNKRLAGAIQDAAWYQLVTFLEYKAKKYGRHFIKVDQKYPSTKLCSNCGTKNNHLTLGDRNWTCHECNTTHDRDINAALNIKNEGIRRLLAEVANVKVVPKNNQMPVYVGRGRKGTSTLDLHFPSGLGAGRKVPIRQKVGRTSDIKLEVYR